jgi:hypothetical protein
MIFPWFSYDFPIIFVDSGHSAAAPARDSQPRMDFPAAATFDRPKVGRAKTPLI